MPYITVWERDAMEKGREKGREEGRESGQRELLLKMIESGLKTKHPDSVGEIMKLVEQTTDTDRLQKLPQLIWTGATLDDFRQLLTE